MPSNNCSRDTRSRNSQTPSFDKSRQERELEELRQRGLTKLLNRHFTEAARRVNLEKAAIDAAQKDLERRKARASLSARPNKSVEVSPLDAMCLQVNKWQKETRRRERETILMYQRYVDTFGRAGASKRAKSERSTPKIRSGNKTKTVLLQSASLSPLLVEDRCSNPLLIQEATAKSMQHRADTMTDGEPDKISESSSHGVSSPQNIQLLANVSDLFESQDLLNKDDVISLCSGLTLSSEQTRQVLNQCEGTLARFLKRELAEVRELMMTKETDHPDMTIISCNDESSVFSTKIADHAELMVKKMQSIVDELQIKSEEFLECGVRQTCRNCDQWFADDDESSQLEHDHECYSDNFLTENDLLHTDDVRPETRIRQSSNGHGVYYSKLRKSKWRGCYVRHGLWFVISLIGFFKFYSAGRSVSGKVTHERSDARTSTVKIDQIVPSFYLEADEKIDPPETFRNSSTIDEYVKVHSNLMTAETC